MRRNVYAALMVLLILFVSAAVMVVPTFFTNGVSRVSMHKNIDLPLVLNDAKDIKLLFFGYSGCDDICTPRLYSLAEFFKTLDDETLERVGVEFLDISVPSDETMPSRFAKFFNSNFDGIYLNKEIVRNYTKEFNVYFSKSITDQERYEHTAHLYLLKKHNGNKQIRYVYSSYPYDFKQISLDIKELLYER